MLVFGFVNRDHYQKIYDLLLRIFQHTPGTYPRIPDQTVYVSEFLSFGGLRIPGVCETRVCWGFLRLLYAFVEDHQPYEFRQNFLLSSIFQGSILNSLTYLGWCLLLPCSNQMTPPKLKNWWERKTIRLPIWGLETFR